MDRIAELEHTVGVLARYVYELALLAEETGAAIADLRRRPGVVVNVVVVVNGADAATWRDAALALALDSGSVRAANTAAAGGVDLLTFGS